MSERILVMGGVGSPAGGGGGSLSDPLRIPKLAIAVTFFYDEERLTYLRRIAQEFSRLADQIIVTIVSNRDDHTF